MIRARNALRPDAACHSADVLTPVERAADREKKPHHPKPQTQSEPRHDRQLKWRDVPAIRAILQSLLRVGR
ncbi:hypothetical protein [Dyella sp. M7H15-1]|uniref:hypothetical protein n=1 Tax=Dyella sp. M7H15-1 TaxID=2501295 RepID=UPI0013E8DBB4|nr:hypothetical protein [Dyella sp. M7H15-1]